MELNRDEIIKALECCTDGTEECDDCPLIHDNFCGKHLMRNALSLIKELTEGNERLKNRITYQVVLPDEKLEEIKNECLSRVELDIKALQADTVRKMQSEIKKTLSAICKGEMDDLYRIIDQIAKEMIGEAK